VLLGILKAGAGYLPIDPSFPEERIAYLMEDSRDLFLVDEIWLESLQQSLPAIISTPLQLKPLRNQLAYCLYTSGSTGNPKGVLMEHGALADRLEGFWKEYHYGNE
jgi:non-ribosomal peptide synthetase component F